MAVRSEGEFELVLGNRQLFSVLGIVVVLLGIFFAMGFFAGKSVGQASANSTGAPAPVEQAPLVVDSPQNSTGATAPASQVPAAAEPATVDKGASDKADDQRAAEGKKQPAASKSQESPVAKPASSKGADQVVKPAPGSYLQVASTRLSEAQSLAALLRKHQFHVVLAESPKADLVRVLVGPFESPEATTQARAKLKSVDIAKPYPVKY
jgi:cell division septation protein DedD